MPSNIQDLVKRLQVAAEGAETVAPALAATGMAEVAAVTMRDKLGGGPAPSPPGTPPARRTGDLQDSITVVPGAAGDGLAEAEVGPAIVYGRIHEFGGDTGRNHATHLPPRPYITPSVEEDVASGVLAEAAALGFAEGVGLG